MIARVRVVPLSLALLAAGLAAGWAWRESAHAAEKAKLLESGTKAAADAEWKEFVYEGKPTGRVAVYFAGETARSRDFVTGRFELAPGKEPHPVHQHAEEEVMVVASGTGEITCDGKTTKVGPGSVMYTEPDVPHGIKNTGDAPLLFYFVKWSAKR